MSNTLIKPLNHGLIDGIKFFMTHQICYTKLYQNAFSILRVVIYSALICWLSVGIDLQAAPSQQEAEKKLANVQAQIQKSQRKLEKDRGEIGQLEKELRQSEQLIGQLNQQLRDTETTLENSRQRIHSLDTQKQELLGQLSKHRSILYAQIRSEYLYGGQEKLKLLLNQQEPTKLARTLVYYDYLHRARLHEIEQATQILQSVNEVQNEIVEQQNLADQYQKNLLNEKQLLEQQLNKRKSVLANLSASVSTEQANLSHLERDEKQLKELVKSIREVLANIPVIDQGQEFKALEGKLFWPVVGKPNNQFGQKRNAARSKISWQGVFIPSNEGNNVRSIFHGRVAFAEWMRGLGLLIIVDHGDGYMSLYGHNQSLYKQSGEWVNAGELIATVGNSGGNTRPGLYFEIRKQGKPINPAKWCTKPAVARQSG